MGNQTKFDSYAQGQQSVPTTTRNSLRQTVSWYLPDRWSALAVLQFEQNEELDLDHRLTGGGAMSRTVRQTNTMELSLGAGLVATQEQYSPTTGRTTNSSLEGLLALDWEAFRFDSPKLDFSTGAAVFPSLSQAGRVRSQTDVRLTYEVFNDFNAGVRLSDTFDSRPPEGATKNDYIVTLTIGWSYRR
jgi:putative salt-induced outer membrane protein YdiY